MLLERNGTMASKEEVVSSPETGGDATKRRSKPRENRQRKSDWRSREEKEIKGKKTPPSSPVRASCFEKKFRGRPGVAERIEQG